IESDEDQLPLEPFTLFNSHHALPPNNLTSSKNDDLLAQKKGSLVQEEVHPVKQIKRTRKREKISSRSKRHKPIINGDRSKRKVPYLVGQETLENIITTTGL
ncbi:hypothetical protein HDV02_005823, partial [Globomyces sp. JEL0801]